MLNLNACVKSSIGINDGCLNFPKIRPSKNDVLTDNTKAQIIAHDLTWDRLCK
jgi:hypothetical protein